MKKVYQHPQVVVEEFTPNEYVAACGDEHKVYKFTCNAPSGTVYTDARGRIGGYEPCNKTHEASSDEVFESGFVDRNRNGRKDEGEAAYIWLEMGRNIFGHSYIKNWHATTNLDMDKWETAKS